MVMSLGVNTKVATTHTRTRIIHWLLVQLCVCVCGNERWPLTTIVEQVLTTGIKVHAVRSWFLEIYTP